MYQMQINAIDALISRAQENHAEYMRILMEHRAKLVAEQKPVLRRPQAFDNWQVDPNE